MSTIVERFLTDEFRVCRPGPGKYVRGRYEPGDDQTVTIYGSLQPLSARELKMVTEGYRLKQAYRFYSDQPLIPEDERALSDSDRVTINGDQFRVISSEPWLNFDLTYFKAIVAREPEQDSDGEDSA